ncbi:hypothetical protein L873DRAFT_1790955 [Choiromyces venosus 120613-1]|uniref:Uncharacterized protein n=1 Tax=Choiromyces venosus 120613-1 TaxID=1336337 RepID=A0A3N4JJL2_9PEZI|nr:hypothetical protein L873DRAFT_1790955 [Choiromyces venosus 120613-1]
MEVANKVKRAAKIMIHKLADLKTALTRRAAIVDASEKMEKFTRIYSPQIKFLSVDEFVDLLKAVVQSLVNGGGEEGAEIADPLLQKPLFAFLDVLKLSETQARMLGLYPILELYWVGEEFGDELDPDVFAHITSIRDTLVRKNKASEDRLINHNYVPEDYLARMQKRVLSLGNISQPVLDDWDKFLEASAPPPKTVPRAKRLQWSDKVNAVYAPAPITIKHIPVPDGKNLGHVVSKLIAKDRFRQRLKKTVSSRHKVMRERVTIDEKKEDDLVETAESNSVWELTADEEGSVYEST